MKQFLFGMFFVVALSASLKAQTTILSEGFEGGATPAGWTVAGLWHRTGNGYTTGTGCLGYCTGESAGVTPNGTFDTGSANSGAAYSAAITLPASGTSTLSFQLYSSTENNASFDQLTISVATSQSTAGTQLEMVYYQVPSTLKTYNISTYNGTTVYVRFFFNTVDNVANAYPGVRIDNFLVTSTGAGPGLFTSTTSLNLGTTPPGTAGTPVSYTVSGNQLANTTTIAAPTGVEISLSQASGYVDTLPPIAAGTWGPTTIWARIKSTAAAGPLSGNISHTSSGVTTQFVAVTGYVGAMTWPCQLTSTAGFPTANNTYNMGYSFNTTQTNVTVTHLAGATPQAGTLTVSLWDSTSTAAPVGQVTTATGASGAWRIGQLATPVVLVANREYRVAAICTPSWFNVSNPPAVWKPSGTINWRGACWNGGTATATYPLNGTTTSNWLYGTADIGYTTGPNVSTTVSSLNLGSTPQGTAGSTFSYTVTGYQTTASTVVTAPARTEIKRSTDTTWVTSLTIPTTGDWSQAMNIRLSGSVTPGAAGTPLTHVSGTLNPANITITGTVTPPTLTPSTTAISLGTTTLGTAGTPAGYTLSGSGMQGPTTISAPPNVEVSFTSGSGYLDSIQHNATGQWSNLAIYARIKASAPQGAITGNITHTSSGAAQVNVSVNGTVTGPTISTSLNTLPLGSTYETFASTPVTYTVSGSILSNQTTITAPTGVEVSFSAASGYAGQITQPVTGTWGPTTIYARIAASAAVGAITGNIVHASSPAANVNVAVNGTVNAPSVVPSTGAITLGQTTAGTAGSESTYTLQGFGTRADTVITAPSGVEVSFTTGTGFAGTITQTTQGSWGPINIFARISATASPGPITGDITHATTGATTTTVGVSGNVIDLAANPTSLALGNTPVGTPSAAQSYLLTGSGLVGSTSVTVTAGDIEIGVSATGTFSNSITLGGASVNQNIFVRLTGATLGAVNGTVTNTNSGVSVIVTITGNVTPPNDLGVTRNGPASTTSVNNNDQGPGGNGLVVLDFTLGTNQAAWTVVSITFTESGTMDGQADLNFIGLYEDSTTAGTQGTFDGPATDLLATAASAAGFNGPNGDYVATLSNGAFAVSTSRRFFLAVKLAGTASSGETLQAEITAINANSGGGGSLTGVPTTSADPALDILPAILNVAYNGPSAFTTVNSDSQGPGGNGHVLLDLTLTATNDPWTVTSMTFTASGTADEQADINFLALYVDNGNGTFDGPTTDTLATAAAGTSFNAPNGTYTAALTAAAGAFTNGASKRFFLVARLSGSATSGETFRASLTGMVESSPSGGSVTGMPSTASSALIIDVATLTLNAGPANGADTYVEFTGAGFAHTLGQVRMTASNDNFTISGFTLTLGGTGDWVNNITALRVHQDNGNGTFEPTDTQLFSGVTGATSVACTFTGNVTVNAGTSVDFWIVIDVAATAGASPSESFNARIQSPADVNTVTAGNVMMGSTPPLSHTLHVIVFAITGFTPIQDAFAGGAFITITGSGFAAPISCTINGVPCPGTATADATGTTITGLRVPAGSGSNLAIVLTTNNLPPRTLTQTFSYSGNISFGGGGGGGGGGGCETGSSGHSALILALLGLFALACAARRLSRQS